MELSGKSRRNQLRNDTRTTQGRLRVNPGGRSMKAKMTFDGGTGSRM
jgi:hypothetical protein